MPSLADLSLRVCSSNTFYSLALSKHSGSYACNNLALFPPERSNSIIRLPVEHISTLIETGHVREPIRYLSFDYPR